MQQIYVESYFKKGFRDLLDYKDFMERFAKVASFDIKRIQTDKYYLDTNGLEPHESKMLWDSTLVWKS